MARTTYPAHRGFSTSPHAVSHLTEVDNQIQKVGWALPTIIPCKQHRFLTLIPPRRWDRHRIEHSDETLNTANSRGDQHKTMVGDAHPAWLLNLMADAARTTHPDHLVRANPEK